MRRFILILLKKYLFHFKIEQKYLFPTVVVVVLTVFVILNIRKIEKIYPQHIQITMDKICSDTHIKLNLNVYTACIILHSILCVL